MQNVKQSLIWLTIVWALCSTGCNSGGSGGGSGGGEAQPSQTTGTRISGYVRDANGIGIKGVAVKAYLDAAVTPPFPESSAETNSDGYFVLIDQTSGTRQIRCSRNNYAISPEKLVIDLQLGDQSGINFTGTLTEGGAIFENLTPKPLPAAASYRGVAMARTIESGVFPYARSLGFSDLTFKPDGTFTALVTTYDILPLYYPSSFDSEFHESYSYEGIYAYEGNALIADGHSTDTSKWPLRFVFDVNASLDVLDGRVYYPFEKGTNADDWLYFDIKKRTSAAEPLVTLQVVQRGGSGSGNLVPNARVSLYIEKPTIVAERMYTGTAVTDANGIAHFGLVGDIPPYTSNIDLGYRLYAKVEADGYNSWLDFRYLGFCYGFPSTHYVATRLDSP